MPCLDPTRCAEIGRALFRRAAATGRRLTREGADAIWPPRCWVCGGASDGATCGDHHLRLGLPGERCGRCAARLPPGVRDGSRCRSCRHRLPAFASVHAVADYADPATRDWLLAFKHGARPDLAVPLGERAAASLRGAALRPGGDDLLVPVPLHPVRRLERGYDQAALLAGQVMRRRLGRAVPLLRRSRATAPQGAPHAPSRSLNVRDAFVARAPIPARAVAWIVDDVLTSGATADACARALRRAGARDVRVLVLARAS